MTAEAEESIPLAELMQRIGSRARKAFTALAQSTGVQRARAIDAAANALTKERELVLTANARDLERAVSRGLSAAMQDRLALDSARLEGLCEGLRTIAAMPDPVGRLLAEWQRPNGLAIQRVAVPLGVIGIIYESRPNVTADAAALCIKAGNAVILRGGSESFESNRAIHRCFVDGLEAAGLPVDAVQLVPTRDRDAVTCLLSGLEGALDVVVPRGGRNLVQRVQAEARVPVIGHLEGLCHVYLHRGADIGMGVEVAVNAKMRRTGVCGAAETLLVDAAIAADILPPLAAALAAAGCAIRGDQAVRRLLPDVAAASGEDWSTEYLDAIVSIAVVEDMAAAIGHIRRYGSGHTDSIVTNDVDAAEHFLREVDSAIVLHNASTQFADGGEFGMGGEIGIATGRVHARGPVGAEQLTSYKYVVRGNGQTRA